MYSKYMAAPARRAPRPPHGGPTALPRRGHRQTPQQQADLSAPRCRYTKEERKVTWETRKIMDLPDLPVSCTCVRIPTLRAHAEAITIETARWREMQPR